MMKRDLWAFLKNGDLRSRFRRGNCASISILRLIFSSWIYVFASLCISACLLSILSSTLAWVPSLCLFISTHLSFHPSLQSSSGHSYLPFLFSSLNFHLSSIPVYSPIQPTCKVNEDYFNGSILVSLSHFKKEIRVAKATRTRKWKWLELDHFCFTLKPRGMYRTSLIFHYMMPLQDVLNIMHFEDCCFNQAFLEINHLEIE